MKICGVRILMYGMASIASIVRLRVTSFANFG